MRQIKELGHEVGLHSEALDLSQAMGTDPFNCLKMEIDLLRTLIGDFHGIAPHRSPTGVNNIDWFATLDITQYGAFYNAYDKNTVRIFPECDYLSDSHIYHWRRYRNGTLLKEPECICEDLRDVVGPVYILIHPHLWYSEHFFTQ